jgi:hypothetical protein
MADASGLLDEHAPRNPEDAKGSDEVYQPTDDEKKTLKLVERLFEKAKRHRALYDEKWLDFYRMFRGKQWKEQRPSFRHSEVVNLIFRSIQSTVPIQVDTRPRFEFLPEEPSDMELAKIVNQVAESDWTRNNWGEQLLEVVYDSNFYGTGLSKMVVKEVKGEIKPIYESIDPLYCYPDPDARDVNKDCGFFLYAFPTDVKKIKHDYPDKKKFIKPDIVDLNKGAKTDLGQVKFRSPSDNRTVLENTNNADIVDKEKGLLITCWIAPEYLLDEYDEKEKKTLDPETGLEKSEWEQVAKYPNGRKIVICSGVVLEDEENGYDDAEIPYQRYVNYMLPREFWGMSEVEQLEGPQRVFNKMVSFALDVMTLMGNPIWKVPTASGIDVENLTNRPGMVLEYDGGADGEPKREEGTQLQPYVLQMIDRMAEWFDSVSGAQDVSRGVQPAGITAASAISSLQEAAQTRIRQKTRNMDYYLQNLGTQWVSRLFQFRTAPEIYRITGDDGANNYFRMHVEHYDKTKTEPVLDEFGQPTTDATGQAITQEVPTGERGKRMHVQPYGTNGQYDPTQAKLYEIRGKLDCRVTTGSSLPFAKDEKEKKLLNYFDRQIIDAEEVLKGSDYPNWQAVLQRMEMKAQQAAQAEAMAAQQGAAPAQAAM